MFLGWLADLFKRNSKLGENDTGPRKNINPGWIMFQGFLANLRVAVDRVYHRL